VSERLYSDATLLAIIGAIADQLCQAGHLDAGKLVEEMQRAAAAHRESGTVELADGLHRASEYFLKVLDGPPLKP
jgi:hypothetical protein